ncbi:GAF domain-containing sensor histidine kinase [Actinoplanes sp. CA-030573]|uniref:GAF domain-containing sensor histidine kinase n=1 Tax=Actinoplanes sp. CA-030573 TaxID=3239898 RepID=UPI003D8A2EC6
MSEQSRLAALYSYGLLDAVRPVVLDDLTRLAARIFDTPMAIVSLVDADRQWFAGKTGMADSETSRDISFCAYMIDNPRPLIVPDARLDPRFRGYRNVTGDPFIRFYAGVPLVGDGGHVLGSVCVVDREPRTIGSEQVQMLGDLAAQAAGHLEAIREQTKLAALDAELSRLSGREQDLVATVSHELRTPVTTMQGYLEMLVEALGEQEQLASYRRMIDPIRRNGDRLVRMVDHLLAGARPAGAPEQQDGLVDLTAAVRGAVASCEPLAGERGVRLEVGGGHEPVYVAGEAAGLGQAVEHLIRNAILFSSGGGTARVEMDGAGVEVTDEGAGIPSDELPYVFERFYRGGYARRQAVPGMGLGLPIAWRIVTAHGGSLTVSSPGPDQGTSARVLLPAVG